MRKKITFRDRPMTLVGRKIEVGKPAPDFNLTTGELKNVILADYKDNIKVLTFFLSLDTPVCDMQVKEFNKKAADLKEDVVVLGISKDLPFAQKRFCESNNIENVVTLSDYKTSSFGINYGVLIKELNLLARGIIIVDKDDTIRYIQIVDEATNQPDYDDAMEALKGIIAEPHSEKQEKPQKCVPCEAGTPPLEKEKIEQKFSDFKSWELIDNRKLKKTFKQKDFIETIFLVDTISVIAEEQQHHPDMTIIYNKLKISLTTHAAGGLTDNDFIMAQIIDEIAQD